MRQILWWAIKRGQGAAAQLLRGREARRSDRPCDADRGADRRPLGPLQRCRRRPRPRSLAALPAMLQRIDDWIAAGVLNGEQLNAADFQIAPSLGLAMTLDDLRPAIERPARRGAGEARRPELPRHDPADPPARLAGAAARLTPVLARPPPLRADRAEGGEGVPRRVPSGSASSGSSSSSGARTKRRLVTSGCGRVRRSVESSRSPSRSRSTSSGRGLWRGAPGTRPRSASISLQRSSSASGSSSVRMRTAALRKSGWSSISPTGSVS